MSDGWSEELWGGVWRPHALCRGAETDGFYPCRGQDASELIAICDMCVVRLPCLEEALANNELGVWGGTSYRERLRIRKAMRLRSESTEEVGDGAV